jgi:hypothetical protein
MIVIHSRNPWANAPAPAMPFAGKLCLLLPESDPPPTALLACLSEPPFIFEMMGHLHGTLDTLRSIVLTVARSGGIGPGPLVYLTEFADPAPLKRTIKPGEVTWSQDRDGELDSFVCGQGVVQADLFVTFFQNMQPRLDKSHTENSMGLFVQFFGKTSFLGRAFA